MSGRAGGREYDERGIALSSPVAVLSLVAVVLAGVAFVSTNGDSDATADATKQVTASATPSSSPASETPKKVIKKHEKAAEPKPKPKPKKTVRRDNVFVEVYNNSGISGLAGTTADTIAGAGWQVVGSDNWYGTIPASTVYYPDRLHAQARLLARDLGIKRLKPAISPMRFDRLTVILTSDYS